MSINFYPKSIFGGRFLYSVGFDKFYYSYFHPKNNKFEILPGINISTSRAFIYSTYFTKISNMRLMGELKRTLTKL